MTPSERIAAVLPIADRMLPDATPFEKALLATDLASLATVNPEIIATIWDPWRCPAALLPWLAWALSVDVWDKDWSEDRKRRMIAAAPMVHRLKGTRGAVHRALEAFNLESRIIEWWEESPPARRGTFRVEMIYRQGSAPFEPDIQGQAISAVKAAKPKSRVMIARAVIQARGPAFLGAYGRSLMRATVHPYAFAGETRRAPVRMGATAAHLFSATAHPRPGSIDP